MLNDTSSFSALKRFRSLAQNLFPLTHWQASFHYLINRGVRDLRTCSEWLPRGSNRRSAGAIWRFARPRRGRISFRGQRSNAAETDSKVIFKRTNRGKKTPAFFRQRFKLAV